MANTGVFDPLNDFLGMVNITGFPGTITVQQVNVDTGNITANSSGIQAIGRTTDAAVIGLSADGNVITKGKRFFFQASSVSFTPKIRDAVLDSGNVTREITDISLIGFDTVYRVETHAVPPPTA